MVESVLERQVQEAILEAGWSEQEIFASVRFYAKDGGLLSPDFFLSYNLCPLAIVEVKSSVYAIDPSSEQDRVRTYAVAAGVPFAFIADGNSYLQIKVQDDTPPKIVGSFPSPQDLWTEMGYGWNEEDPRLYPPYMDHERKYPYYHAQAVGRAVSAISEGKKHIWIKMAQGSGKSAVLLNILWKLLHTGTVSRVLVLTDRILNRDTYKQFLSPLEPDFQIGSLSDQAPIQSDHSILLAVHSDFGISKVDGLSFSPNPRNPNYYDLIVWDSRQDIQEWQPLFDFYENATLLSLLDPTSIVVEAGLITVFNEPIFNYDFERALQNETLEPPTGFRSVKLGDIAELITGRPIRRENKQIEGANEYSKEGDSLRRLLWKSIQSDGSIDLTQVEELVLPIDLKEMYIRRGGLLPGDILLPRIMGREKRLVGIVSETIPTSTVIDHNIIRIRVDPTLESQQDIYEYFRSDLGQSMLRRYASGLSSVSSISIGILREMPVFVPEKRNADSNIAQELSTTSRAIVELKSSILPLLEKADKAEETEGAELLNQAAIQMHNLATILVPPTLEERVISSFPTPIAVPFSRFLNARFNIYEQVLRLIDVVEAVQFFVYNVLLLDTLQKPDIFFIKDAGARRAFNGYSMSARMDFIKQVQTIATTRGQSLFIEELADTFNADDASQLTETLRNQFAHTATAPEGQQQNLLRTYTPRLEALLDQLDFLRDYRMTRVPSIHFENRHWIRQLHVYQGITPFPDTEEITLDMQHGTERNHLVILNSTSDVLDLYPFYQLVTNEHTRYETHIGFLKQRKQAKGILEGESVEGAFSLQLEGFDDLEELVSRIRNEPQVS